MDFRGVNSKFSDSERCIMCSIMCSPSKFCHVSCIVRNCYLKTLRAIGISILSFQSLPSSPFSLLWLSTTSFARRSFHYVYGLTWAFPFVIGKIDVSVLLCYYCFLSTFSIVEVKTHELGKLFLRRTSDRWIARSSFAFHGTSLPLMLYSFPCSNPC